MQYYRLLLCIYRSRSSLHTRSEVVYTLPATRVTDNRRAIVLECLERSELESGYSRQHSGYGMNGTSSLHYRGNESNQFSKIYNEVDEIMSTRLLGAISNTFPMKRINYICNQYESIWKKPRLTGSRDGMIAGSSHESRGPFPYVDDKATVLGELTKGEILRTRHRVNSHSHPKWAIRTIRRRKRKRLLKFKRRSISQEQIRSLQSKMISSKSVDSKQAGG